MTLDLWMGIAIGMMVVIVTVVVFLLLMKPPTPAQRRNMDEANNLLRARNNIGVRQCEALEAIAGVINDGGDQSPEVVQALVAALKRFDMCYTNEQLAQLAAAKSGRGEITPNAADRQIQLRAAIAMAEGREAQ